MFRPVSRLQTLLASIEQAATTKRQEKVTELHQKQQRYNELMSQYRQDECEYVEEVVDWHNGRRERRHYRHRCARCSHEIEAESLSIDIFEWPLPSDNKRAKSVAFEIRAPVWFSAWRDTTVFFILDVLKSDYASRVTPRPKYPLLTYSGLADFLVPSALQRIQLISADKPHTETHRKTRHTISDVTEHDVCFANGLNYQYYDSNADCVVNDMTVVTDEGLRSCSYKLPMRSASIQEFIFRPTHSPNGLSPNTVIARQFNCPGHMSIGEYNALASIPLGQTIQWQNILVQLALPSVDFKKIETALFILQAVYQAGLPGTSFAREGHKALEDENSPRLF